MNFNSLDAPTFNNELGAPLAKALYAIVNGKIRADSENRQADREMRRWERNTDRDDGDRALSRALQAVALAEKTGTGAAIPGMDQSLMPQVKAAAERTTYQRSRDMQAKALEDALKWGIGAAPASPAVPGGVGTAEPMGGDLSASLRNMVEFGGTPAQTAIDQAAGQHAEDKGYNRELRAANLDLIRSRADKNSGQSGPKFNDARSEASKRALLAAGLSDERDLSTNLVQVGTNPNDGTPIYRAVPLDQAEKTRRQRAVELAYGRELARMGWGLDGQPLPSDRMPQATEPGAISGGTRGFDEAGNPTEVAPSGEMDLSSFTAPAAPPVIPPAPRPAPVVVPPPVEPATSSMFNGEPGGRVAAAMARAMASRPAEPAKVKTHSLSVALRLPFNAGKTPEQVRADLVSRGYQVTP